MKKIGIDARLYFQTGVGVYLRNLLYYLQKSDSKDFIFYIYLMKDDFSKVIFKNKSFIKREVNSKWHSFSEQTKFLGQLNRDKLDLVHFPYFGFPALYRRPFVTTIHDVILLTNKTGKASVRNPLIYELKHFIFRNIILKSQIKNAITIITPTGTIKNNIVSLFGQKYSNKIVPLYEGINYELLNAHENKNLEKRFHKSFFLYVGNFYPHKNVERLILAFSNIEKGVQLVLAGPDDFFAERTRQLIAKLNQEKKIILFQNPKIEDFVFFYKKALALVHPSLSEGFGLPLVEAIYFELPIIASDIEVFKEVLRGQYLAFDPYDVNDIKNKIDEFLNKHPSFNYKDVLPQYSFETMTKKTLEVYNKAIHD